MTGEAALREQLAVFGKALWARGLAPGTSGNMSVRTPDGFLITPTNSCLGRLTPDEMSKVDDAGRHVGGARPSKEVVLHLAVYAEQPEAAAIVHLHSTHCVALSCLDDVDPDNVLPPLTAYFVMRIDRLPLVPYFPPGDPRLAAAVRARVERHAAVLLANHGSIVTGASLESAAAGAEELEETAKIFFLLRGRSARTLTPDEVAELRAMFPRR